MRDDDTSGLPVARIEPRDAADRMVIARAAAARRAGQLGRAGIVVGKIAGFVGLFGLLAVLGGTSRPYSQEIDIKLPRFEYKFDHKFDFNSPAYRQLMLDLAKLPKYASEPTGEQVPLGREPKLADSQLRDPFEPPAKIQKQGKAKAKAKAKAKRQPRP
jgi:hypothetical protein